MVWKKKSVIWAASLTAKVKIKEWWVGDRGDEVNSGEDESVLSCTFLHVLILCIREETMTTEVLVCLLSPRTNATVVGVEMVGETAPGG